MPRGSGSARSGSGIVRVVELRDRRLAEHEGEAAIAALTAATDRLRLRRDGPPGPATSRAAAATPSEAATSSQTGTPVESAAPGQSAAPVESARSADAGGATIWVDLADPDPALVARVASILGLHPLIAEDVVEGNQRAKVETTEGLVHVVVFALEAADGAFSERNGAVGERAGAVGQRGVAGVAPVGDGDGHVFVRPREIDLVLGDGFLLSAHPASWDPRAGDHFRSGLEPILEPGADHLLWAILDAVVDGYFPFADELEDLIDRLQDRVVDRPDRNTLEQLFALKRDLIAVRRAVSPVREILNQLTNRELRLIDPGEVIYFRDIYDHVIRLADELDTDRELVAATVEIYLSTINNNLSVIMKRLTGVTVILAGIGAIAGIFGMSEAGLAFSGAEAAGFWLVTIGVVAIAVGAAAVLRRIDWI